MKILIAERLRPFSHRPGTQCLIPKSEWQVQVFPALLRFENLLSGEKKETALNWRGPVLDFTVELDLEKNVVKIFGHTQDGYRCITVQRIQDEIFLDGVKVASCDSVAPETTERLSLGMSKALDWELVCRRRNLCEIFPVWHRLGSLTPQVSPQDSGTASLLQIPEKKEIAAHFTALFMAAFQGILAPRLFDNEFQGIVGSMPKPGASPLVLLSEGARLIRSLFFQESSDKISLLPHVPPQFFAGRFLRLKTRAGHVFDLEWTKKTLRRVVIHPKTDDVLALELPKAVKRFRVREHLKDRGRVVQAGSTVACQAGHTLWLDRFES